MYHYGTLAYIFRLIAYIHRLQGASVSDKECLKQMKMARPFV